MLRIYSHLKSIFDKDYVQDNIASGLSDDESKHLGEATKTTSSYESNTIFFILRL